MWVSVPEQKSQIKIEQQLCDDSVTVKHLQWRNRNRQKEGERESQAYWDVRDKWRSRRVTVDKETERAGWGWTL